LTYTEMVSAKGIYYNDEKTKKLTAVDAAEEKLRCRFLVQIVIMAKVTEQLNDSDACIIDINMGCPTPKITKNVTAVR